MKPAQVAQLVVVAIAALAVYSFARTARDAEGRRVCTPLCAISPNYAARNRKAPDFELPTLTGEKVSLSSFQGKVVILNFWTKTCGPCLEELPSLAELARMLKTRKDIELVTLCTDESADDARTTLSSVLGTAEPPFWVLMDPEASVVRETYGTKLYPETWFIDTKGVIRARIDGPRRWNEPIAVSFAESLKDPLACDIEFRSGRPIGPLAGLCGDGN
ncbi:MAG: TlpA disulfide reductase family protein [Polyangiaceae bacterium]